MNLAHTFVSRMIFSRDLMKDKLGAVGVSGRDPADDDDDYTLE